MATSGIKTHTHDPINPTKGSYAPTQSSNRPIADESSLAAKTTEMALEGYPPARPAAAAPTPTSTATATNLGGPPPPQPGAVPVVPPPMVTPKPGVPPPPKVGEKPQPPEYYAPSGYVSAQPQTYPPQMSYPPFGPGPDGLPPASTTSTTRDPSFPTLAPSTTEQQHGSVERSARASLDHPAGYVQNPYASEMTPNQRCAAEKEHSNRSNSSSSLGYSDNARQSAGNGAQSHDGVFEAAIGWGKEKGKQFGDLHEQVWDRIGRK